MKQLHMLNLSIYCSDVSCFGQGGMKSIYMWEFPVFSGHSMNFNHTTVGSRDQNNGHLSQVIFQPILVCDRPNPIW